MDENIKFSVAIPAYKPNFLKKAIQSIVNQTYQNWELIILDDNSPHKLMDIISKYLGDKRIKYYTNKTNVGAINVVDNWNKCLSLATGDYFLCMGDDDILYDNALEIYCKYIYNYPSICLFHANTEIIDENSEHVKFQEQRPLRETMYSMVWFRLSRRRDQYIGDFLFKTDTLRSLGGFYKLPLAWASDDISSFLCAESNGVINIPDFIFKYRINRYTISNTGSPLIKLEAIKHELNWYVNNIILNDSHQLEDIKFVKLIRRWYKYYFWRKKISTMYTYNNIIEPNTIKQLKREKRNLGISSLDICLSICISICYKLYGIITK